MPPPHARSRRCPTLADDIVEFVGRLNAKLVIPIHTIKPETFQRYFNNVQTLADGEVLAVA